MFTHHAKVSMRKAAMRIIQVSRILSTRIVKPLVCSQLLFRQKEFLMPLPLLINPAATHPMYRPTPKAILQKLTSKDAWFPRRQCRHLFKEPFYCFLPLAPLLTRLATGRLMWWLGIQLSS